MAESDCPWCGVRKTHASYPLVKTFLERCNVKKRYEEGKMVKERSEPADLIQILEIVAVVHGRTIQEIATETYRNSHKMFFSI